MSTVERSTQHTRFNAASKLRSDIEGWPTRFIGDYRSCMLYLVTHEAAIRRQCGGLTVEPAVWVYEWMAEVALESGAVP
jgi:hypothetical protein